MIVRKRLTPDHYYKQQLVNISNELLEMSKLSPENFHHECQIIQNRLKYNMER